MHGIEKSLHMQSEIQHNSIEVNDTIDLQDMLLTIAENCRLLVFGSLLVGAVAYGAALLIPKTYESSAILKIDATTGTRDFGVVDAGTSPSDMAALITTNAVLNRSLRSLGQLDGTDEHEAEDRLNELRSKVGVKVGRADGLLTLRVAAPSAEAAQKTANTILKFAFEESRSRDADYEKLQAEVVLAKQLLAELEDASDVARSRLAKAKEGAITDIGEQADALARLAINRIELQNKLYQLERRAAGVSDSNLLQAPTLPLSPVSPRKALIALIATLGSGFALLLFVFLRQAWKTSFMTELQRQRWFALRKKYGRKH